MGGGGCREWSAMRECRLGWGRVCGVAVGPAVLYGLEAVALAEGREAGVEVAELKVLRFSLGVAGVDGIGSEYIRGTAQVGKFGEKTREAGLGWFGRLRRRGDGCVGRGMLGVGWPGGRGGGGRRGGLWMW